MILEILQIQALLDQLLNCHHCGASLHDEGTYHCEDCPDSCEEAHHDPACRPLEELRREAQGALDRIRSLAEVAADALTEANKDKARLTKLIEMSSGPRADVDSWLSDVAWDHACELEVPEDHAGDSQYLIRAAIDWEMRL